MALLEALNLLQIWKENQEVMPSLNLKIKRILKTLINTQMVEELMEDAL